MTSILHLIRAHSRAFVVQRPRPSSSPAAGGQVPHLSNERGVALILTLAILVLVTMLVIAFAVSMRVENTASKNFNDLIKARELAQAAIDQAVATIRQATPLRTQSGTPVKFTSYVTFPGVIYTNYYDGANSLIGFINLFSAPTAGNIANLNAGSWITDKNSAFAAPPNEPTINVGWVYVAENGSVGPPPRNAPLVGRFAFWVDDEASKININTAYQRPLTSPDALGYSTNSEVDLRVLEVNLNAQGAAIQATRSIYPYATTEEVKRASPAIGDPDFTANRFYLTAYSVDSDDLDVFDRVRKNVHTLNPGSPPANLGDFDTASGVDSAYNRLADSALQRIYSPPGGPLVGTFASKYNPNGLKQIIANIIAYQLDNTSPTLAPPDAGNSPPDYLGLAKTPYINELRVQYVVQENPQGSGNFFATRNVSVELFYMYDGTYNPVGSERITVINLPEATPTPLFSTPVTINVAGAFASGSLRVFPAAPEIVPLTGPVILHQPIAPVHTSVTYRRVARLDYAEMNLPTPSLTLDPGNPGTQYQDVEVNDPAVNDTFGRWTTPSTASGSLGNPNEAYKPLEGTVAAPGLPSKAVMRGAQMQSLGELGYIHQPGTAWKYLTLQPGGGGSGVIPDWAMLDIFTVGAPIAGRININSFIPLFPVGVARLVPLEALLNNVVTPASLNTIAHQIYNDDSATAPIARITDLYGIPFVFDTVGEICEIQSLAGTATTEAGKEAAIRRIANLITVRSNTFTIWVIANSIKEVGTPDGIFNGQDLITGEVRAQAVVERYEQGGLVRFRVKYFRYL